MAGTAVGCSAALVVGSSVWLIAGRPPLPPSSEVFVVLIGLATLMFTAAGWFIVGRAGNRVGLVFVTAGLSGSVTALVAPVVQYGVAGPYPWWLAWLGLLTLVGPIAVAMALSILFLLFPTGSPPSRRWRWVARLWVVGTVVGLAATVLRPGPMDLNGPRLANPLGVAWLGGILDPLGRLAGFAIAAVALLGIASLAIRARGNDPIVRAQVRWLAYAGALALVAFLLSAPGSPVSNAAWTLFLLSLGIGIPGAVAVAILRYRLYDIDLVISKTIVFGALAAFTTLVYVVVVVVAGRAIGVGSSSVPLSIAATAVVAVAFQPLRERLQRLANRLVYGRRATPYEVLARFSDRVAEAYATEDVLPRMARILAEGVHASRAVVWLRLADRFEAAASWPRFDGEAPAPFDAQPRAELPAVPGQHVAPVRYRDELLGALAVDKARDEPLTPDERSLLDDLASQAGLVLANVRMTADLEARLRTIERQAAELKASRQRIVAAQDAERRRLERNIHDGAQQHLVALAVKLRLVRSVLGKDPARARSMIADLRREVDEALETLRALALGIYPPLLEEEGIAAALADQYTRGGLPVRMHADGLSRLPIETEAAVYFCVLEALQNTAKHARATTIDVTIAQRDHALTFEVRDDGAGFDPSANGNGTGLAGMRDRLAVLGGDAELESSPGRGTTVRGTIPLDREGVPA